MSTMPATVQERISVPAQAARRPDAAGAGLTPGDFLRIIRQRIFLVIFVWLFVSAAGVGMTWVWIEYWPAYEAVGFIRVESTDPRPTLEVAGQVARADYMDRLLEDQAILLTSPAVLADTLADADVKSTAWYQSYEVEDDNRFLDLQDDLIVTPMKGTSFVQVRLLCKDPGDPHRIVNAAMNYYQRTAAMQARSQYDNEMITITSQLEQSRLALDQARTALRKFAAEGLVALGAGEGTGSSPVTRRLLFLTEQLGQAEYDQQLAEAYFRLYSEGQESFAVAPQLQQMIESDPRVVGLSTRLQSLQEEMTVAGQDDFLKNHKYVKSLDLRIVEIGKTLSRLREQLVDDLYKYQGEEARIQYEVALQRVAALQEQRADAEADQRDLDRKLATYHQGKAEIAEIQDRVNRQEEYQRNLRATLDSQRTFRVQQLAAIEPTERARPRWEINVPVGSVLGLLMGLGLAVLLEFVDTSVRTGRDVVRHVNVPILGTIADLDDEEVEIKDVMHVVRDAPGSMVAESFRSIRTNLQLSAPAERQRALVVTSPKPEDGKTAVAVNLAVATANNHRRVLLVDANFRRPAIKKVFPASTDRGLSDILSGQGKLDELIVPSGVERLDVLYAGRTPPNPTERLGSPEMKALIEEATSKYDQVFFDVPPVLLVSDALVLSSAVDAAILVCRAKVNSRGLVQRARDRLYHGNAQIIGAVLNGVQVRRGGYFREQYRAFYDYQAGEPPAIEAPRAAGATPKDEA